MKYKVHISKRKEPNITEPVENNPPCPGCYDHGMGYLDFHEYCRSRKPKQYKCEKCLKFCFSWQLKKSNEKLLGEKSD